MAWTIRPDSRIVFNFNFLVTTAQFLATPSCLFNLLLPRRVGDEMLLQLRNAGRFCARYSFNFTYKLIIH